MNKYFIIIDCLYFHEAAACVYVCVFMLVECISQRNSDITHGSLLHLDNSLSLSLSVSLSLSLSLSLSRLSVKQITAPASGTPMG